MLPRQWPERFGQGEGQQKIVGGNPPLELTFQPQLTLMVLAVRAVSMTTGVWHKGLALTLIALRHHNRTLCGAAVLHHRQRLAMAWQNRALIVCQIIGFKSLDNG